ncbi:hypothetical protein ACFL96_10280 [Thermoproteota archaeon]
MAKKTISTDDITKFFKNLPDNLMKAPVDEKIAYGAIVLGFVLVIVGIIL